MAGLDCLCGPLKDLVPWYYMGSCSSNTHVEDKVEDEVEKYAKCVNMDQSNKEALKILIKEGPEAVIKHVMTNPHTGEAWSYAESRSMYG